MLTASVAVRSFEAVALRNPKVVKLPCVVGGKKLHFRTAQDLIGNVPNRVSGLTAPNLAELKFAKKNNITWPTTHP